MDLVQVSRSAYDIPIEIIVEILSWLPVKSLLRFKSVCKSWKSLISNPYFVQKHLDRMLSMDNNPSYYHLLFSTGSENQIQTVSLPSLLNFKDHDHHSADITVELPLQPTGMNEERSEFVLPRGSCHGLVLLLKPCTNTLLLLNPSTRKAKILPDVGLGDVRRISHLFGFGYDRLSNDYKVVEIYRPHPLQVYPHQVWLYSLRENSWRRIGDCPYANNLCCQSALLRNFLVWARPGDRALISFDLGKEIFRRFSFPKDLKYALPIKMQVMLLAGCLCTLHTDLNVNIWKMGEPGVEESWSRLLTFPYPKEILFTSMPFSLWMSQSTNEVVFQCDNKGFAIYNMNNNTFTSAVSGHMKLRWAELYMGTLVCMNDE